MTKNDKSVLHCALPSACRPGPLPNLYDTGTDTSVQCALGLVAITQFLRHVSRPDVKSACFGDLPVPAMSQDLPRDPLWLPYPIPGAPHDCLRARTAARSTLAPAVKAAGHRHSSTSPTYPPNATRGAQGLRTAA